MGRRRVQPSQDELRQTGVDERRRIGFPDGDDEGHRLGTEAASGEDERLGGRRIQEPGVVDERDHRPVICARPEQAQRRCADREPVSCDGRTERQRSHEGGGLRRGDVVEIREQRPQQVRQGRERQPRLELRAGRREHRHTSRVRSGVVEEGRLSRPRLAPHDDHAAPPVSCPVDQAFDLRTFSRPAAQRRWRTSRAGHHWTHIWSSSDPVCTLYW